MTIVVKLSLGRAQFLHVREKCVSICRNLKLNCNLTVIGAWQCRHADRAATESRGETILMRVYVL